MTSARSRQQRRQTRSKEPARTPAVWRGTAAAKPRQPAERPEHGVRDEISISWRVFSGGIVAGLTLMLLVFFATDLFYVRSIRLENAVYLTEAEVFRLADIAEDHVFWVDSNVVRERLLNATPLIADAEVRIGWPPDMVVIEVEERQPSLLWTQSGIRVLIDVNGNVLRAPREDEQFPDLVQVVADNSFDSPRLPGDPVPLDVVTGALQLQGTISGLPALRYNASNGLGFREANGTWDVWLGTGADMSNKLRVYETLRDNLLSRGIIPSEINVGDLDAVFYREGN